MSTPVSNGYFVELGEYSLILAKTNLSQRPRAVEELREVWLGDAPGVEAALKELKGDAKAPAIALFRLKGRVIAAPDAGTAKRLSSSAGAVDYLGELLGADRLPANWAVVSQKDGRNPDGVAGLLDAIPTTATDEALAKLSGWSFDLQRCQSATLALTGALSIASKVASTTILLVDVSENQSALIAIGPLGVTGFASTQVGFDALAEATQGALGLKFRGSAARLMFNDSYDFSDSAAKIVEPLANAIKTALATLGAAPAQIVVSGVLARQTWLTQALSTAVGLKYFAVDTAGWTAAQGVTLAANIPPAGIAPTWLGVLGAISAYDARNPGGATPWNPIYTNTPVAPAAVVSALVAEPPAPKVVVTPPPPAPAPKAPEPVVPAIKVEPPKPVIKPAEPVAPPAPKPAVVITPPPKPVEAPKPVAAKTPPPPAKPIEPKPPAKAEPPKPVPAPVVAKAPVKPEPTKAAPAPKPTLSPAPAPVSPKIASGAPFPQKKNSLPVIIAIVVIVLILGVGYYFHIQNQNEVQKREKEIADEKAHAASEGAARRAAEEKLQHEADARKKDEVDAAARAVAADKARIEAEARARQATTEEMLNGRGSFALNTEPAGASVAIGELAPRNSPVKMSDLRLGRYSVTITLAGYDPEQRDVEIKANAVTDLGTIPLHRQVGGLEITSDPAGLDYELKPAGTLFVNPADIRKGQTPATLTDIPAGSYQLTVVKPNWPTYTTTLTVEHNGSAKAHGTFQGGTIVVTSTPAGAAVMKDQVQIGVTPLTLNDVVPGDVTFTLTQRGLESATVSGHADAGKTLTLNGTLLDADRVMKLSELDERPVPLEQVEPDLSSSMRADGGSATIDFVVGKDGVPVDLRLINSSSAGFGKSCLAAAAKWRFRPGMVHGKAVRTHITLPFRMSPGS